MQTFAAIILGFAALALSAPIEERQTYTACSGLYDTAQCCATDVLGVADLNCANRKPYPRY